MLIFFLFLPKNIDCGYTLEPTRCGGSNEPTHNLCFGSKIRKIGIPLHTPVLHIKVGFRGVYITRTCFRDEYFANFKPIMHNLNAPSLIILHIFIKYLVDV